MTREIPHFLQFLIDTPYMNEKALTRFWFTPQQTDTEALYKIMQVSDYKAMVLKDLIVEKFKEYSEKRLQYCPIDIIEILAKEYQTKSFSGKQIGEVFKSWGLKPRENASSYKMPYWRKSDEIDFVLAYKSEIGRFYTFERKDFVNDCINDQNEGKNKKNANEPF
jgi:hypothetical protein